MTATELAAYSGLVTGVIGATLGVLNYWRDRAALEVSLNWDMNVTDGMGGLESTKYCVVRVTNVGRRPLFIHSVHLKVPATDKWNSWLLTDSMRGTRLAEGDPPLIAKTDQARFQQFARNWRLIRAVAIDSTGRAWASSPPGGEPPSWATEFRDP